MEKDEFVNEDVKKALDELANTVQPVIEKTFNVKEITIYVKDDSSIVVSDRFGLSITYPYLSDSWSVIMGWILRIDKEDSQTSIANFFNEIAFPIVDIRDYFDSDFLDGIIGLRIDMYKRIPGLADKLELQSSDEEEVKEIKEVFSEMISRSENEK